MLPGHVRVPRLPLQQVHVPLAAPLEELPLLVQRPPRHEWPRARLRAAPPHSARVESGV